MEHKSTDRHMITKKTKPISVRYQLSVVLVVSAVATCLIWLLMNYIKNYEEPPVMRPGGLGEYWIGVSSLEGYPMTIDNNNSYAWSTDSPNQAMINSSSYATTPILAGGTATRTRLTGTIEGAYIRWYDVRANTFWEATVNFEPYIINRILYNVWTGIKWEPRQFAVNSTVNPSVNINVLPNGHILVYLYVGGNNETYLIANTHGTPTDPFVKPGIIGDTNLYHTDDKKNYLAKNTLEQRVSPDVVARIKAGEFPLDKPAYLEQLKKYVWHLHVAIPGAQGPYLVFMESSERGYVQDKYQDIDLLRAVPYFYRVDVISDNKLYYYRIKPAHSLMDAFKTLSKNGQEYVDVFIEQDETTQTIQIRVTNRQDTILVPAASGIEFVGNRTTTND